MQTTYFFYRPGKHLWACRSGLDFTLRSCPNTPRLQHSFTFNRTYIQIWRDSTLENVLL